ncbi:hypothetical protein BDV96DRAFT_633020, partial [Lophiotrema nucula]
MDPASATVAFVGFAASITTLTATLFNSCKTLRDLCHDLGNAPQDLHRLLRNVQILERMVIQVKQTGTEIVSDESMAHLDAYWKNNATDMETDLQGFHQKVSKLQSGLDKPSVTSKHVRARFYKVFTESDIAHYERLLSQHLDIFTVLYTILSNERSKALMNEFRLQTKKLDQLASTAESFHATVKSELRTTQKLCSGEHRLVLDKVKSEVRALSRQLPEEASILSHLHRHGADVVPLYSMDQTP